MDVSFEENDDWSTGKYSPYEQECLDYFESLPDVQTEGESEKFNYERKIWNYFQNSALSIAQLHSAKDNNHIPSNSWNLFQQASTNVACLYKECAEYQKKLNDSNHQSGYHKRTKEVLTWVKKKKSHIRREEVIAFLTGRNTNYIHHNNSIYHHKYSRNQRQARNTDDFQRFFNSSSSNSKANSRLSFLPEAITETDAFANPLDPDETNLKSFNEAISLSSLRNASYNSSRRSSPRANIDELREFINQEYTRHTDSRKRPSSMDVCMDSPTHNKRTKFC